MRTRALRWAVLAASLILFGSTGGAESAVDALLGEINKLPPHERQKRLEEGVRREGAFLHYSVSNADLIGAHLKGFMVKYPFIKGEFWRGSGNQLVFRTLMEHRSGKLKADVISVGTENVMELKRSGIFARYRSPEAHFYPPEQHDKDGYFHSDSLGLATVAYNHQLVKKEEAPKTYNDLLDPKWKGSLSIDLEPERALMAWLLAWGEAKTRDFVQELIANGASVRRGQRCKDSSYARGSLRLRRRSIRTRSSE